MVWRAWAHPSSITQADHLQTSFTFQLKSWGVIFFVLKKRHARQLNRTWRLCLYTKIPFWRVGTERWKLNQHIYQWELPILWGNYPRGETS